MDFFFLCIGSSLLCAGFLQLRRAGATLRCYAPAPHCGGFSCCRAQALGAQASVVVARGLSSCGLWALERRFSSCGAWAQLLRGVWDLPGPGLEPVSPTLAGGVLTTVPPGKSPKWIFEVSTQITFQFQSVAVKTFFLTVVRKRTYCLFIHSKFVALVPHHQSTQEGAGSSASLRLEKCINPNLFSFMVQWSQNIILFSHLIE